MRKALIVGIDGYTNLLNGCVNDAREMASLLETNGDGSPNFEVLPIFDDVGAITKGELMTDITKLFEDDCDVALFYFAGHGTIDTAGSYIVTPDHLPHDVGISMEQILTLSAKSNAKNKIIILDCCHSGAMGTPAVFGEGKSAVITDGMTILAASKEDQSAQEVSGRGVFTTLFCDALKGGAADLRGDITPGSVYAYIDQTLGPWSQRPIFKTNVKTFVSLRSIAPPISKNVVRKLTNYFKSPTYVFPLDPSFEPTSGTSNEENTKIFSDLQSLVKVGLVIPTEADHMYYAAMDSKGCKLTNLGLHYWRLVNNKRY